MAPEAAFEFYIENGEMRSLSDTAVFEIISGNFLYEVIKVIDGVPLFFEDHLERLMNSAVTSGVAIEKSASRILDEIALVTESNQQRNVNVKLVCGRTNGGERFLTYLLNTEYPEPDVYKQGVDLNLFSGERKNPNIKAVKSSFRQRAKTGQARTGAYETLLVNSDGYITEGSRSNIFFLKNERLITPPAGTVLMGVTRKHVLAICNKAQIPVTEQLLHRSQLPEINSAFITGTSIDVLPVRTIDGQRLASISSPCIAHIIRAFQAEVERYIRNWKRR